MTKIESNEEIREKLEAISKLIEGDSAEKNIGRLNYFIKKSMDVWFFIDPASGTVAKGAEIACSTIGDLLNGLQAVTQQDIDRVFNDILDAHNEQLDAFNNQLALLIPKASLTYVQNKWEFTGHGLSSVTGFSNTRFKMNLNTSLSDPDSYFAHCNVSGSYIEIDSGGIDVTLPEGLDLNRPIKVMLQRMTYDL